MSVFNTILWSWASPGLLGSSLIDMLAQPRIRRSLPAQQKESRMVAKASGRNAHRRYWSGWRLIASGSALLAVLASLIVPVVLQNIAVESSGQRGFYVEPVSPDTYRTAQGTGLYVEISEEKNPFTYVGATRFVDISITATFSLPDSADSLDKRWTAQLPSGIAYLRNYTALKPGPHAPTGWSKWEPVPAGHLTATITPETLTKPGSDEHLVVLAYIMRVKAPVTSKDYDTQFWRETWTANWNPRLATQPAPQWGEAAVLPYLGGGKISDVAKALDASRQAPDVGHVEFSLCGSCTVLQTFGDLKGSSSGIYTQSSTFPQSVQLQWETIWFPWFWLTPVGIAVTLGLIGTIITKLIMMGRQPRTRAARRSK
jgi:hypothetical protein